MLSVWVGVLIFQASLSQAFGYGDITGTDSSKGSTGGDGDRGWNGFRVTFSPDINNPNAFTRLPQTSHQAQAEGWKRTEESCTCDQGVYFGYRYIKYDETLGRDDPSVMLLYDDNGYIAGIQTGISDSYSLHPAQLKYMHHEKDKNIQTATVYFVDPTIICNGGRTGDQFKAQGTGDRLLFRCSGNLVPVPLKEEGMRRSVYAKKWERAKCFPYMGQHYYYKIAPGGTCDDFQPFFVLYDVGKLKAFGWGFLKLKISSPRWEYTNGPIGMKYFLPDSYPDCMYDLKILSTIHVFLTDNPEKIACPKKPKFGKTP